MRLFAFLIVWAFATLFAGIVIAAFVGGLLAFVDFTIADVPQRRDFGWIGLLALAPIVGFQGTCAILFPGSQTKNNS